LPRAEAPPWMGMAWHGTAWDRMVVFLWNSFSLKLIPVVSVAFCSCVIVFLVTRTRWRRWGSAQTAPWPLPGATAAFWRSGKRRRVRWSTRWRGRRISSASREWYNRVAWTALNRSLPARSGPWVDVISSW